MWLRDRFACAVYSKATKAYSASNRSHKLIEKTLQWRRGDSQAIREVMEWVHNPALILRILHSFDGLAEQWGASASRAGTDH
jgi:hypothetical protein